MPGRLEGKVAIVTGGGAGMGAAECRLFAREGAAVVIADLYEDGGREVEEQIRSAGGVANFAKMDVTAEEEWNALLSSTLETYGGRLDVLVNNAGLSSTVVDDHMSTEGWHQIMNVNATGVYLGTKLGSAAMLGRWQRRLDCQHLLDLRLRRLRRRTSGLPRVEGGRAQLLKGNGSSARAAGHPRELGSPGIHAADAIERRDVRGGARATRAGDPAATHRRGQRGGQRGAVPGLGRVVLRDRRGAQDRRRVPRSLSGNRQSTLLLTVVLSIGTVAEAKS